MFADIIISVLPPVGRVPETSQLGLRDVGVELDKGGFVVGGHSEDHERTSVPNVYAVGDVLKVSEQIFGVFFPNRFHNYTTSNVLLTSTF